MDEGLAELEAASARVHEGERAAARRNALERQIEEAEAELDRLHAEIAASEHRVEDLQGLSLTHVIAALRRSRGEAIDAASAEVRAAQLEVATRSNALEQVRADYSATLAREHELPADRRALEAARAHREAAIASVGGAAADRLRSLSERRSALTAEAKANRDALAAANDAVSALRACGDSFSSAGNWSTYDTFFGGGMVADHMQNKRLDDAAQAAADAEAALQRLAADMHGLQSPATLELPEISDRLKTFDMWFGGFFTDMKIHNKIRASEESVGSTEGQVFGLATDLRSRGTAIDAELGKVNADYEALLTAG